MLKLLLSPQATNDLEDIYEYTLKTWGSSQAEKYQDELYDSFLSIADKPLIGSIYYYKKGDYRKLNINRHLVFYRIKDGNCLIIRILHERMDLKTQID